MVECRLSIMTLRPGLIYISQMNKNNRSYGCRTIKRVIPLVALLFATCSVLNAQSAKDTNPLSSISADKGSLSGEVDQTGSAMTDEMRVRREIKFAEKEHQENLDRASEASALGENLAASFKKKNCLDRDDIKKLDKLEKLAKRIRSEAGGTEDDLTIEEKPKDPQEAMTLLAKVSASLNHKIQETPRRVISAEIIERANVLLELVRIVRNISGKV